VGRGGADDNGDLTYAHPPDPVPEHGRTDVEVPVNRSVEFAQHRQRGRFVDLVVERDDPAGPASVRPDPSGEQNHPAEPRHLKLLRGRSEGERPSRQTDGHPQPPLYGGWTASSSPGRTRSELRRT
jgi:hypothetical protein